MIRLCVVAQLLPFLFKRETIPYQRGILPFDQMAVSKANMSIMHPFHIVPASWIEDRHSLLLLMSELLSSPII